MGQHGERLLEGTTGHMNAGEPQGSQARMGGAAMLLQKEQAMGLGLLELVGSQRSLHALEHLRGRHGPTALPGEEALVTSPATTNQNEHRENPATVLTPEATQGVHLFLLLEIIPHGHCLLEKPIHDESGQRPRLGTVSAAPLRLLDRHATA